jgi:hypothetical protein
MLSIYTGVRSTDGMRQQPVPGALALTASHEESIIRYMLIRHMSERIFEQVQLRNDFSHLAH